MMRFLWLSLAVLILDQATKLWIDSSFTLYERVPVIPGFFDLMLAYNKGAAFSFLADQDGWQRWFFTGLKLVISIALFIWLRVLPSSHRWTAFAIALVIGGAIGNLVDRIFYGGLVVDFIDVGIGTSRFYTFNVADMGVTVGGALLFLCILLEGRLRRDQEEEEPAGSVPPASPAEPLPENE